MSQKRSYQLQKKHSGSSASGEPEYVVVGFLRRPHGIKGEMIMSVLTDFPERLVPGVQVFIEKDHQLVNIRSIRWHGADMLISFDEFHDRETVGVLRNQALLVRVENLPPLPDGDLYIHEFIGLKVIDDDSGTCLGEIQEIIETGANDVFIVRGFNGAELLIPDIDEVVRAIDMDRKEIRIYLLPGLV